MMAWMIPLLLYVVLAPAAGCLLAGIDRKLSARMQRRMGPPLLQPYYDVRKLMEKEQVAPNRVQDYYMMCFLLFTVVSGCILFGGGDLLMVVFTLALAETFLALAAFSSGSPYSQIGAHREIYVSMAAEPILLLTAIGFYLHSGTFDVSGIATDGSIAAAPMVGLLVATMVALTMKLRKSPFDLSMSHHAHQDIVRGMATEFSGRAMAAMEVAHWYESVMLFGLVALFFMDGTWAGAAMSGAAVAIVFVLETLMDNAFARMTWQTAIKAGWATALILGLSNVAVLLMM